LHKAQAAVHIGKICTAARTIAGKSKDNQDWNLFFPETESLPLKNFYLPFLAASILYGNIFSQFFRNLSYIFLFSTPDIKHITPCN
jgi:hypothetical protein